MTSVIRIAGTVIGLLSQVDALCKASFFGAMSDMLMRQKPGRVLFGKLYGISHGSFLE